jgi:DNA-directed RNA polymerase subunit E'/Rpb7
MKTTESIRVPSIMLTRDLKTNILDILKAKESTCTKKYGYITKIWCIDKIYKAYVTTADSSNIFQVEYTFDAFKPELSIVYQSIILAIFPQGIIAEINGCVKVLIVDVKDYVLVGQVINIRLNEIAFKSGQYQCVGQRVIENVPQSQKI